MCGLSGVWDPRADAARLADKLRAMTDVIRHRGPDDSGLFVDAALGLGLGHRRLAIIDLSADGHQPMSSASGRLTMVFNGEIYSYKEMAADLRAQGCRFRSSSDTEVLLEGIERWGLEATLARCVGMFALAYYDRALGELVLVRDRLGIKPMYYSLQGGKLLFGSELKCLMADADLARELDNGALEVYLRLGYIPAPDTILRGVQKLKQGHLIRFKLGTAGLATEGPQAFWSLAQVIEQARANPPAGDERAWIEAFRVGLDQAVRDRLVADVPLGAFLSGGVDSSLVVASMQRAAPGAVKTFSIGFRDEAYNEAVQARAIAAHLGTEHHELYLEERQLLELVPQLPTFWCEPFGDSSQLPTLLLAKFARTQVTVALSGDGGDELAGGYVRHVSAARLQRLQRLPGFVRALVSGALAGLSVERWDRLYRLIAPALPKGARTRLPGDKFHKLARALRAADSASLYREVVSLDAVGSLLHRDFAGADGDPFPWRMPDVPLTAAEDFMVRDTLRYLPDDVLTKVDRATMAYALEARVPLLDHRLMALVWSMPESIKLRGGGKYLLREALALDVPRALWERPKMGFAAPIAGWTRGALKPYCEDLLSDVRDGKVPWLDGQRVAALWQRHSLGQGNTTSQLWHLLMFLAWRRTL